MFYFTVRLKTLIKMSLCIAFLIMLILNPEQASNAAKEGFNISLYLVLPSLFPFAVISSFICSNIKLPTFVTKPFSRILGISEQGITPFIMGVVSGYPVGSILISEAVISKRLAPKEAEHLLPFANAAGPLFLISVTGLGMFGSLHIGYFLYIIHLSSIILAVFLFKPFAPQKSFSENIKPKKTLLVRSIDRAMNSMLNVAGCIAFFSVVSRMLSVAGFFNLFGSYSSIPQGILELTSGLNRLAISETPLRLKLAIASFLCGFSGLCIFLQVANAVREARISCKKYILIKLLIATISFILTWLFYPYLPITVPTFANSPQLYLKFMSNGYGFTLLILPIYRYIKSKASFFDKR